MAFEAVEKNEYSHLHLGVDPYMVVDPFLGWKALPQLTRYYVVWKREEQRLFATDRRIRNQSNSVNTHGANHSDF